MRSWAQALAQAVVLGVVLLAGVQWLAPDWLRPAVVQVPAGASSSRSTAPHSYADAVNAAAPAVVNIYTAKLITEQAHPFFKDPLFRQFFGDRLASPRQRLETSLGSGVIVSDRGYVLTNHHVVAGADQIEILLRDGRSAVASLVGSDPDSDLAVLRVALDDTPSIVLGDSDALAIGDVVLAIGNPFGVGQTVTQGIVSATGRNQVGINTYEDFIQTDAAINPGNSGGALVNSRGELVGINSAIFTKSGGSEGIGFAIPLSLARWVMEQIIETGRVERGWLGIEVQSLDARLAESFGLDSPRGLLVAGVMRDGPADRAGLIPGDLILAIDGETVANARDGMNRIGRRPVGSRVSIEGLRDGQRFRTEAVIRPRPQDS